MRRHALLAAMLVGTLGARAAHAGDACTSQQPEAGVPIRLLIGPAALGTVPEACAANEVALQSWGAVLIAANEFYGSLDAGGAPVGRFVLPGGSWVSVFLPGFEYRFVANASIEAEAKSLSGSSLGWHVPLSVSRRVQIAPFARVLFPSETVYHRATRFGFDEGIAAVWRIRPFLELTGGYSMPVLLTVNRPTVYSVLLPTAAADLAFEPWRFFAVVAGASIRLRSGDTPPFESFDPRAALRFYPFRGSRIELAAAAPLFGRDRTDLLAAISMGYVWGQDGGAR